MKNIRTRYKKPMVNNLKLINQYNIKTKTLKYKPYWIIDILFILESLDKERENWEKSKELREKLEKMTFEKEIETKRPKEDLEREKGEKEQEKLNEQKIKEELEKQNIRNSKTLIIILLKLKYCLYSALRYKP